MASTQAYTYTPLKPAKLKILGQSSPKIRVLELLPGNEEDEVKCVLIRTRLGLTPFEALSYCWGSLSSPRKISMGRKRGKAIDVTANLFNALRRLRYTDKSRFLWVDALCIDQSNNEEKSCMYRLITILRDFELTVLGQVECMRQIFQAADQVLVWLADEAETHDSLDLLLALLPLPPKSSASVSELLGEAGAAATRDLARLLSEPGWWKRMWVVQEVTAAKSIEVQVGSHSIPWPLLSGAILSPQLQEWLQLPPAIRLFVQRVDELRTAAHDPPLGLLSLAYDFRHREVTKAHDRLYALRGILNECVPDVKVDYAQPETELWRSFAKACIREQGNLLVLALNDGLPCDIDDRSCRGTWCPNWTAYGDALAEERQPLWRGSLDADEARPRYRPTADLEMVCETEVSDPAVIIVRGLRYPRVAATTEPAPASLSDADEAAWKRLLNEWYRTAAAVVELEGARPDLRTEFIRTINAGREEALPLQWWRTWYDADASSRTALKEESPEDYATYRRQRNAVCRGRMLVVTEDGRLGLAHGRTRVGDTIMAFPGADVLFVVRENHPSDWRTAEPACVHCRQSKQHQHGCPLGRVVRVVGQAYVHGLMHYEGNIREDMDNGTINMRDFFLD